MAKNKFSLGEGGMKGVLARHIEKILFGLVALMSLMIIWSGFSNRKGIDANKTPDALSQEITRATAHLDTFSWDTYREERSPDIDADLSARAAETLEEMDESAYAHQQLLVPPVSTPRTKRTDPDLLVAINLQVRPGYGALVKSTSRGPQDGEDQGDSVLGRVEEEETIDRDPEIFRRIPSGYGPQVTRGSSSDAGKGVHFIVVTGLAPFRKQLEIYQSSFLNASSFSPGRDVPTYVSWILERSPVAQGSDKRKWTKITSTAAKKKERVLGGARVGDGMGGRNGLIDAMAQDLTLTRPAPPLLARDLDRLMCHDRILTFEEAARRRREEAKAKADVETETPADGEEEGDDLDIDPDSVRSSGGVGRGGEGGYGERQGGFEGGYNDREGGFEGGNGGGEMGGRQAGPTQSGSMDPSEAPEFKMFRYVDLDVHAGRSYVYRLKLVLQDPNFPASADEEPPESSLEGPVIQRRKALKAAVTAGKKRRFYRISDASDESPVVTIMEGQRLLAGEVKPARLTLPRDGGSAFYRTGEEPTGKAMALKFDIERAADIPGQFDVRRGTAAQFKVVETEVLRPGLGMLEKMEDVAFNLNWLVLDLRGGEKHKADALVGNGQMLVLDARGRLKVLSQQEDQEDFQGNIFPPEERNNRRGGPVRGGGEGGLEGGRGDRPNFGGRQ